MANEGPTFVIASERPWNRRMAANLSDRTGHAFHLIQSHDVLTVARLAEFSPNYIFFPHWSHKIPEEIFEGFTCVIFHMTDLPFGRGGSPLQNLIASGISDTMITALKCQGELDAGPVYLKRPLNLNGSAEEIFLRAANVIEDMIVDIVENEPEPVQQSGEPTYFKRRRPDDGDMRDVRSLDSLFDLIRMLDADGYPRAFADVGPFRLEFSRAARRINHLEADVKITLKSEDEQ